MASLHIAVVILLFGIPAAAIVWAYRQLRSDRLAIGLTTIAVSGFLLGFANALAFSPTF